MLNGSTVRLLPPTDLQRPVPEIQTNTRVHWSFRALKTNHKESAHQFQPPCFWCNGTNKHMAQWLGWFPIHWLEYVIPVATFRRQPRYISIAQFKFHSAACRAPQIQKPASDNIYIQYALGSSSVCVCVCVFHQDRIQLGTQLLYKQPESMDR